jgi:hypothetical protein
MSVIYYKYSTYFSSIFCFPWLSLSWLAAFVTLNDKPWQATLNKAPSKGGKEEEREREDSSPSKKHKNPKWVNAKS